MLPSGISDIDPLGLGECERRMSWKDACVRISGRDDIADSWRRELVLVVLHHASKVCADIHAGDDPACILAMRPKQGDECLLERIHVQSRIEHGANLAIVQMAAGTDDDCLSGADGDGGGALVGVAVVPEAFEACAGLGSDPWRIAWLDSENPAGELPLADDFIHVAVQHEPHAFFPSAEFQAPRQAETAVDAARRPDGPGRNPGSLTHRIEARVPLLVRVSPVLR